jgi:acetyltransferase-like isoleucine patch superfamily enzyme
MFLMRLASWICLIVPPSVFKNWLLNQFSHIRVDKSAYIGFSYIFADEIELHAGARIKHFVRAVGLKRLVLKENCFIGNFNTLFCSRVAGDSGSLVLGKDSELVKRNLLDLTDDVTIGDNVVIGGYGSQFWTHGFDVFRNRIQGKIFIDDNVYVGSSTIFNLGLTVCSQVMIGAGSVVSKSIVRPGFYAGVPAILKSDNWLFHEGGAVILSKTEGSVRYFKKVLHGE